MKSFKVKLKEYNKDFNDEYPFIDDEMIPYFGKGVTVMYKEADLCFLIDEDDNEFLWNPNWFENNI